MLEEFDSSYFVTILWCFYSQNYIGSRYLLGWLTGYIGTIYPVSSPIIISLFVEMADRIYWDFMAPDWSGFKSMV